MRMLAVAAAAALLLAACDTGTPAMPSVRKPVRTEAVRPEIPLGQLPDTVEPLHYALDLNVNPDQLRYDGVVTIDVELKAPRRDFFMHGRDLDVATVTARLLDGTTVTGTWQQVHESGVARLVFDGELPRGKATITLPFTARFETAPDALTSMTEKGARYAWTQFEEISARRAFPCFDEPRFKTPFDITITGLERDAMISNAPAAIVETPTPGVRRTVFATTAPLPTYLVAMMVGPYDVVPGTPVPATKLRPQPLPLRAVTVAGKGRQAAFALARTPALITSLEEYFAAPFPYPKLDLITPPNFSAGGMENAGAITYTERGILLDDSAPLQQKRSFTTLHAHELAHQWFGDLVTPKWWNDIWLNESFASWMANRTAIDVWPEGDFSRETLRAGLSVMDLDSLSSARAIRQPIRSNDDIFNAFDGLTYSKGAAVLGMFESYLGPDAFREGIRLHMRRFAHGTANLEDFLDSLARGSRHPEIGPALQTFLNQPGVPLVRVETTCQGRDLDVTVSQTPYAAATVSDRRLWSVPVCMRETTRGLPLQCTLLTQRSTSFRLPRLCGTGLMPNANGAGYYRFSMESAAWRDLVKSLPRLAPSEQLATLHSLRSALRSGEAGADTYLGALQAVAATGSWDVIDTTRSLLADIRGDILAPEHLPAFETLVRSWFSPSWNRLGPRTRRGETPATILLRASVAEMMVGIARDPAAIATLAAPGTGLLKGVPQPALPPELVRASLWAAIHSGGAPAARDAIAAITASDNGEFRLAAIEALAAARDPEAIAAIQQFAISGALRVREFNTLMRTTFADAERRDAAWAWLQKDFDRISAILPEHNRARFIGLAGNLCSTTARQEIETFFKQRARKMPGAPRTLANTLEDIERCISWKAKAAPLVGDAIRSLLAPPPAPARRR